MPQFLLISLLLFLDLGLLVVGPQTLLGFPPALGGNSAFFGLFSFDDICVVAALGLRVSSWPFFGALSVSAG